MSQAVSQEKLGEDVMEPAESGEASKELIQLRLEVNALRAENSRMRKEAEEDKLVLFDRMKVKQDALDVALRHTEMLQESIRELVALNDKLDSALHHVVDEKMALEKSLVQVQSQAVTSEQHRREAVQKQQQLQLIHDKVMSTVHGLSLPCDNDPLLEKKPGWLVLSNTQPGYSNVNTSCRSIETTSKPLLRSSSSNAPSTNGIDMKSLDSRREAFPNREQILS